MKHLFFIGVALVFAACNGPKLTQSEVSNFAISHIENQIGLQDAVPGYVAGIAEDALIWNNPFWRNTPRTLDLTNVDGRIFYEDSINVTLHDVYNGTAR